MSTFTVADAGNDPGVIDLEPTLTLELAFSEAARGGSGHRAGAVAIAEATLASLASETDILRRQRLLAAAVFLAATFGLLLTWVFVSDNPGTLSA